MQVNTSGLRPRSVKLPGCSCGLLRGIAAGLTRKLAHRHRRVSLDRRKDIVFGKARALFSMSRHTGEDVEAEVSTLEPALAK